MKKRDDEAERALKELAVVEEADRKIPDGLRRLLHDLVCDKFERKPVLAAEGLRRLLKEAADQRGFRTHAQALQDTSVLRVVKGRQTISYSMMDAMSQSFGVPMGLMLLFSRVRSDVSKHGHTGEALRVVRAVNEVLSELEAFLVARNSDKAVNADEELDHQFILEFFDKYDKKYNETFI